MFPYWFCQWPSHAGIATADDVDAGMFYSGLWVPDGDPHTFGHHDTWTNQSGASVLFNFIGTQIQVFATRRPEGTYLTNVSFAIDEGPATLWTTTDFLPEITYQNLVYTSPPLSPAQHRITITNFGQIFWLDYVQFTTADSLPNPGQGGHPSPPPSTTARTPPPPSTSHSPTTQSEGPRPSPSSSSATLSSGTPAETTTTSDTTDTLPHPAPSDTSAPTGTIPVSTSTPSPTATGEANPSNAGGSGSSSRAPMIIGIAIGAVGALAVLLTMLWWLRMRRRLGREGGLASVEGTTMTLVQPLVGLQPASSSSSHSNSKGQQFPVSSPPLETPSSGPSSLGNNDDARYRDSEFPPSSSAPYSPTRRPLPPAPEMGTALFDAGSAIAPALSLHSAHSTSPLPSPMVRHSRDAGIRLAGGPLDETGSQGQMWALQGYDPTFGSCEIETLPPAYAQIHGSAGGR
ncbi:hypothetical protein C8Q74DRAFT_1318579 [Fomes fomentarius]|nr:hypothetical protein C8Q74DRAFT_1318579 [Fomes fomentarius]